MIRLCVMAKSEPFSMRLSADLDELISEEARRTNRSKGSVVEALAIEGLKMRLFPGIGFYGDDWDRRAWVRGTNLDVSEIVDLSRQFDSPSDLTSHFNVNEAQINLALAYYKRFSAEIDRRIAVNRVSLEELRRDFPALDVVSVDD